MPKFPGSSPDVVMDLYRSWPSPPDAWSSNKEKRAAVCSIPLIEVKPVSPTVKMPVLKPPPDVDPKMIVPPPAPPCRRGSR